MEVDLPHHLHQQWSRKVLFQTVGFQEQVPHPVSESFEGSQMIQISAEQMLYMMEVLLWPE